MNSITKLILLLTVAIFASVHSSAVQKQASAVQVEEISLPSIKIAAPARTVNQTKAHKPIFPQGFSEDQTIRVKNAASVQRAEPTQDKPSIDVPAQSQGNQSASGVTNQSHPKFPH